MNAEQMRSALVAFADLIGEGHRSHALRRLAEVLEGLGSAQVNKVVDTIESNWRASRRSPCHPADLRIALEGLQRGFELSGAAKQAKAFAALLRLCTGSGSQPVDAFVAEAASARVRSDRPRENKRPEARIAAEHAREIADRLASAADDRDRFDTLLDQMKGQLNLAELKAVARFYTGYETTKKKKDDIIRSIRNWHRQDELNRDRSAAQAKVPL
jgi:hypothetical protein